MMSGGRSESVRSNLDCLSVMIRCFNHSMTWCSLLSVHQKKKKKIYSSDSFIHLPSLILTHISLILSA